MMRFLYPVIFFIISFASFGINDSLIYRINPRHKIVHEYSQSENGMSIGFNTNRFPDTYYFLYSNKIDPAFKVASDSSWKILDSYDALNLKGVDFKGEATFRMHYRFTDSTVHTPLVCELHHKGASEVYIDGRLIKKFGKIGKSAADEDPLIPRNEPFNIQHSDTLEHVLTIIYSNYNGIKKNYKQKGIEVKLYFFDEYQAEAYTFGVLHKVLVALSAFFGALGIVHLLLFFADRSRRFNLFYSMFLVTASLTAIWPVLLTYAESPAVSYFMDKASMLFLPSCLFFLLNLMYSFFARKFNFFYYLEAAFFVGFLISYLFKIEFLMGITYGALFFSTYFGVTIIAVKALRKKYNGAKYLGWGVLSFTILFIMGIMFTMFFNDDVFLFYFTALSLLALPLSMTAYLSYDFARTNKSLKEQLIANEELSRKTIEQEKEKQEILANQNRTLEQQVRERTQEINEQKNLLEEKQTEILDSIRYAKRIQNSLLPSEKLITKTISRLRK